MVTISFEWLLQGFVTSLLSGMGFLFITLALEYVKKYCRDKKQKEKALILEKILRGEEVMQWSKDKAVVLVPKGRALGRGDTLSRASLLFSNCKQSSGFMGFGRGYYANRGRERTSGIEGDRAKLPSGIFDFPEWSNLNLDDVKPSEGEQSDIHTSISFKGDSVTSPPSSKSHELGLQTILKSQCDSLDTKLWSQESNLLTSSKKKDNEPLVSNKICQEMCRRIVREYPFIAPFLKHDCMTEITAETGLIGDACHSDASKSSQDISKIGPSFSRTTRSTLLKKKVRADVKSKLIAESLKLKDLVKPKTSQDMNYDDAGRSETAPKVMIKSPEHSPKNVNQKKVPTCKICTNPTGKSAKVEAKSSKKNLNCKSQLTGSNTDQQAISPRAKFKTKRSRSVSLNGRENIKRLTSKPTDKAHPAAKSVSGTKVVDAQRFHSDIKVFGSSVDEEPPTSVEKPKVPKAKVDVGYIVDGYYNEVAHFPDKMTDTVLLNKEEDYENIHDSCEKIGDSMFSELVKIGDVSLNKPDEKRIKLVSFIKPELRKPSQKRGKMAPSKDTKSRSPPKGQKMLSHETPPQTQINKVSNIPKRIYLKKRKVLETDLACRSPIKHETQKPKKYFRKPCANASTIKLHSREASAKLHAQSIASKLTIPKDGSSYDKGEGVDIAKHRRKKGRVTSAENSTSKYGLVKADPNLQTAETLPETNGYLDVPVEKKNSEKETPDKAEVVESSPSNLSSLESLEMKDTETTQGKQAWKVKPMKQRRGSLSRSMTRSDRSVNIHKGRSGSVQKERKLSRHKESNISTHKQRKTRAHPQRKASFHKEKGQSKSKKLQRKADKLKISKLSKEKSSCGLQKCPKSPRALQQQARDMNKDSKISFAALTTENANTNIGHDKKSSLRGNKVCEAGPRTISDYKVKVSQRRLLDTIGPIVTYHPKIKHKLTHHRRSSSMTSDRESDHSPARSDISISSSKSPKVIRRPECDRTNCSSPVDTKYHYMSRMLKGGKNIYPSRHLSNESNQTDWPVVPKSAEPERVKDSEKKKGSKCHSKMDEPVSSEKTMEFSTGSLHSYSACPTRSPAHSKDSKSSSRVATCSNTGSMYTGTSRRSTPLEDITECVSRSGRSSSPSDGGGFAILSKSDVITDQHSPFLSFDRIAGKNSSSRTSSGSLSKCEPAATPITQTNTSENKHILESSLNIIVLKKSALDDVVKSMHASNIHPRKSSPPVPKAKETSNQMEAKTFVTEKSSSPGCDISTEDVLRTCLRPASTGHHRSSRSSTRHDNQSSEESFSHVPTPLINESANDKSNVSRNSSHIANNFLPTASHHSYASFSSLCNRQMRSPLSKASSQNAVSPRERSISRSGPDSPKSPFGSGVTFHVQSLESLNENVQQDNFRKEYCLRPGADDLHFQDRSFQEYRGIHLSRDED